METKTDLQDFQLDFLAALRFYASKWGEQTTLAQSIGLTPQFVSMLFKGQRQCGEKTRRKIAEYYGHTYESFLKKGRDLRGAGPYVVKPKPQRPKKKAEKLDTIIDELRALGDRFESIERRLENLEKCQQPGGSKRPPSKAAKK